jgi:hypothetical protein
MHSSRYLRRKNIRYVVLYGLLISVAPVSPTSSTEDARASESPSPQLPSAPPTTEQPIPDECRRQYSALTLDAEAKAQPIRDASHSRLPASAICKLLTDYVEAESRLIRFVYAKSNKCGISRQIIVKIRTTYTTAETMKGEACSKGASRGSHTRVGLTAVSSL